ncbi:MAG: hypothetical protein V7699_00675 [Porticoccus sp.]
MSKYPFIVLLFLALNAGVNAENLSTNPELTNTYYQSLAEQGSPYAQLVMGEIYVLGDGVPKDYIQAYAWFHVALAQGVEEAQDQMDSILNKLKPNELLQARVLAKEFEKVYVNNQ